MRTDTAVFRPLARFDSISNVVALFSNFFPEPEYQAMRNCKPQPPRNQGEEGTLEGGRKVRHHL